MYSIVHFHHISKVLEEVLISHVYSKWVYWMKINTTTTKNTHTKLNLTTSTIGLSLWLMKANKINSQTNKRRRKNCSMVPYSREHKQRLGFFNFMINHIVSSPVRSTNRNAIIFSNTLITTTSHFRLIATQIIRKWIACLCFGRSFVHWIRIEESELRLCNTVQNFVVFGKHIRCRFVQSNRNRLKHDRQHFNVCCIRKPL